MTNYNYIWNDGIETEKIESGLRSVAFGEFKWMAREMRKGKDLNDIFSGSDGSHLESCRLLYRNDNRCICELMINVVKDTLVYAEKFRENLKIGGLLGTYDNI